MKKSYTISEQSTPFLVLLPENANTDCEMKKQIHIGSIIKEKFEASEHTVAWFARKINYDRTNIYRIFDRESIDTELLMKISEALNFDFFIYYHPTIKKRD